MNRYSSILHCNIINSNIYVDYKFYNQIMHIYLRFVERNGFDVMDAPPF